MIDKLNEIYDERADTFTAISETLARYSDQAIIDLGIWWTLTHMALRDAEVEEFPHWIKDQVATRAEMREEYEASLEIEPTAEIGTRQPVLPKLSVRERWEFCRPRRISASDPFWTDERIRVALVLGF